MKIIITKTYEEYVHCCHQNNLKVDVVPWIQKPVDVEKINEAVEPIYFGKFWEIPALPEIERMMKSKGILVQGKHLKKERYEQHDSLAGSSFSLDDPKVDRIIEKASKGEL